MVALAEVATLNPRGPRLGPDEPVSFLPLAELSVDGTTTLGETRPYAEVSKGYTPFRNGDLLVAKITPSFQNGKTGQARIAHEFGMGTTEFHVVRPDKDLLDSRYALRVLRHGSVIEAGERRMTGSAGQRRVPITFFADLQLPLPPLPDQRRIAGILDHVDALRAARRASLAKLDELISAETNRTAGIGAHKSTPLGECLMFLTSGSRGWAKYYSTGGPLFIRIQNVRSGRLDLADTARVTPPNDAEARRTRVHVGDVLISITADLGRTAVVTASIGDAHISQHLALLRAPSIESTYLAHFLESADGRRQLTKRNRGQSKDGLNFHDIKSLEIPLPPLATQRAFADKVRAIDAQRARYESQLAELDSLFASLQSRAFRGEL